MTDKKKSFIEEVVDDMLEDPDDPRRGNTDIPQTIDAEPGKGKPSVPEVVDDEDEN